MTSPDRTDREWVSDSPLGYPGRLIDLRIPKLREGSYFPDWLLDARTRAERAFIQCVAEAYVRGVSTRRVEGLVETLGIASLSKSQVSEMAKELDVLVDDFRNRPVDRGPYTYVWADVLFRKVREGGRVVNVAILLAVGVNGDGHREILGLELSTTEDGAGWLSFWRGLVARGLSGVQPVISDDHTGLVEAIEATMRGTSWQRCRTHYLKNLLTKVPQPASEMVATMVRTIFAQPDPDSMWAQYGRVVDQLESPQYESAQLSSHLGCRLTLKNETANTIGSFKGRGASYFLNAVAQGGDRRQLVCASTGNFGQAMAYACQQHGRSLIVFADTSANPLKMRRIEDLGAEYVSKEPTLTPPRQPRRSSVRQPAVG